MISFSQLNQGSQGFAKLKQMPKYRAANLKIRGKHISYREELRSGMEQAMPTLVWVITEMERVRCLLLKTALPASLGDDPVGLAQVTFPDTEPAITVQGVIQFQPKWERLSFISTHCTLDGGRKTVLSTNIFNVIISTLMIQNSSDIILHKPALNSTKSLNHYSDILPNKMPLNLSTSRKRKKSLEVCSQRNRIGTP